MIDLVGEDHQSVPLLVLRDGANPETSDIPIGEAKGRKFVEKTIDILRYLARAHGVPAPH
jgi:hypothetical protein